MSHAKRVNFAKDLKVCKTTNIQKNFFIRKHYEIEWIFNAQAKYRRNDFKNQNFKEKNNYYIMSKSSNTLIYSKLTI